MVDTVADAVYKLNREYADHPDVPTSLELSVFFDPAIEDTTRENGLGDQRTRIDSAKSTINRIELLEETVPAEISLTGLKDTLTAKVSNGAADGENLSLLIDFSDDQLAFLATVIDIQNRYPDVELTGIIDEIAEAQTDALKAELQDAASQLRAVGTELIKRAILVRRSDEIWEHVNAAAEPRFRTTKQHLREEMSTAIEHGAIDQLQQVANTVSDAVDGAWTRKDLRACTPEEFEVLISDLWRESGFEAQTTRFSRDFNIDVIINRSDGGINLIQAKQHGPDNRVGVKTVQRTAGLIVEFDAEEVFVVTSSSFTDNALESASRMEDQVTLLNGERLCELLTQSPLIRPP